MPCCAVCRAASSSTPRHPLDHRPAGRASATFPALSMLIMPHGAFFLADTYVHIDPTARARWSTSRCRRATTCKRFNIEARAALLSYSNFGSRDGDTSFKMREAYALLKDAGARTSSSKARCRAIWRSIRTFATATSRIRCCEGEANLLIFPNLESANLSMTLIKAMNNALAVGPIILGPQFAGAYPGAVGHQPRHRQHGGHRRHRRHRDRTAQAKNGTERLRQAAPCCRALLRRSGT